MDRASRFDWARALPVPVRTRVAPPLHQVFAVQTRDTRRFVLDLNYAYPGGTTAANQALQERIHSTQLSAHYARATCAPSELVPLLTEQPSPIHRVWPDFTLTPLVTVTAGVPTAPQRLASGVGTVWAVLDTGIDYTHEHFQRHQNLTLPSSLAHRSFTGNNPLEDAFDHGTHTAGIIAGASRTASGIAPEATVLSLQVMDEYGHADSAAIIAALAYISEVNRLAGELRIHGANISLGYDFEPAWFAAGHTPVCKAVNELAATGVLVVVAAGNTGTYRGGITDPGNAEMALTVGSAHSSTPASHGVSFFSAVGPTRDGRPKPDVVAPGEQLISATAGGYEPRSGTSVAAAYASGVAAALVTANSPPTAIKPLLMRTATNLHRDRYYQGAGYINGTRAAQE